MSNTVLNSLISGAVVIIVALIQLWSKFSNDKKFKVLQKVTGDTHDLVNSASLLQLKLYAAALRRISVLTNDPDDTKAALEAEKLYKQHEVKQKMVDEKEL